MSDFGALQEENRRLTAENAQLKKEAGEHAAHMDAVYAERDVARAEVEKLKNPKAKAN